MRPNFLNGIRFVDFTWAGAGSFGTKVFADFGAEVLKIESAARPDPVRCGGPYKDRKPGINRSGYFASRNSGKKSVSLNLKEPEARRIALDLIAKADVVSNNFGPGAMERLGFDYETLKAIKPDLIYLSMPMYGEDGPHATLLGVGMTISAVSGLMWMTGYGRGKLPNGPGTHYPDHAANPYHAAFAVLSALRHRRLTGRGMKIDLSQVESTINFVGPSILEAARTGSEPEHPGNRARHDAPHNIFACAAPDSWCAVAVESDADWQKLAAAIARPDLAARADLAHAGGRLAAEAELEAAVGAWCAARPAGEAAAHLQAAGIASAPVNSARDLMEDDAQLRARGYWQAVDHPEMGETTFASPPYRIDGERVTLSRAPLLGEHTKTVLGGLLGMDEATLADLAERKVLL